MNQIEYSALLEKKIRDTEDLQSNLLQWKDQLFIYKFALDEINTKLKILNEEYQFI